MTRVIAIDIDGTLLTSRQTVLPSTVEWLGRALDQGVHVMISSGRPMSGIHHQIELAQLPGPLAIAAYNGALARDAAGVMFVDQRMAVAVAQEVFEFVRPMPISRMACVDDVLIADDPDGYLVRAEQESQFMELAIIDDLRDLAIAPHKILFAGEPEDLRDAGERLIEEFGDVFQVTASSALYTELVPSGAGKGETLASFCAAVDASLDDAIAFGDAHNDLGMLRMAGLGVAMGNASAEAKRAADRVTSTHDEGGIAEVLADILG